MFAAPGSGSAAISPPADVTAGSTGTWTLVYTAADSFSVGGIVEITIPNGWTLPQDASATSAGYVTVSTDQTLGNPALAIASNVVTITMDSLNVGNTVTLVYGDDSGGANPGAVATAQTGAQTGVQFLVRSEPDGLTTPAAITGSPTLDVVAAAIAKVVFVTGPFTFSADGEAGAARVQTQDAFNNPSPVSSNQQIDLLSSSTGGDFSVLGGGSFSSVGNITILSGEDTASFFYRDTVAGNPNITASGNGQVWTSAVQQQTVDPGAITKVVFLNGPFNFNADGEAGPLTLQTQDQFDNPSPVLSDQQIDLISTSSNGEFSVLGGGSFLSVSNVTISNGNNSTSFYYRDTTPGSPDITASATGQLWTDAQQQETVNPAPPSAIELVPADTTIRAGDFMSFTVRVVDAFGNKSAVSTARTLFLLDQEPPPPNASGQFFNPGNHGTPITQLTIPSGSDSVIVDYRNTTATAGAPRLIRFLNFDMETPVLGSDSATVTVDATSFDGSVSTIVADSPITADGVTTSTVTVTVLDTFANPLSGVTVDLSATSPSGLSDVTDPGGVTGSDGVASGVVTNTVAETVTMTATANGQPLGGNAIVVFQAGAVDADSSTIDAVPSAVAADGSQSTITVTARDNTGNPISGATVLLSVDPPGAGAVLTQPGTLTDINGQAQGFLSSQTAGPRIVHATINAIAIVDSAEVDFAAGSAASFVWTAPGSGVAGTFVQPVTLEVLDANSNRVVDYADTVFISTTTSGAEEWAIGAGAQGVVDSLPNGQWFYKFAAQDSGLVNLRAKVFKAESIALAANRGAAGGFSSSITIGHAAADAVVVVSGNGQTAAVNSAVAQDLVVRVIDLYGNPVSGENVTFGLITGGGSIDVNTGGGAPDDSVTTTDGNGLANCEQWVLGTNAALSNTATAQIASGTVQTAVFSATPMPGAGDNIVLTPATKNVTVGDTTVVQAVLSDVFANPIPGERVDISIKDSPDGKLESNPGDPNPTTRINDAAFFGTTDAAGAISVWYIAPTTAGLSDVIDADASAAGVTQGDVTDAVYTTVASGATDLRIVFVGSDTAPAGQTFSFRVEAVDGGDNIDTGNTSTVNITPELGSGLQFSENDFGPVVTQVTLVAGEMLVYGQGQNPGTWDINVSDQALVLGGATDQVTIGDAGAVSKYQVTAGSSVVAGATFNVDVQALDAFDNPVGSATNSIALVAVAADSTPIGSPDTLLVGNATLGSGTVTVGETFLRARDIRIYVQDGSSNEGYSNVISVNPAAAYRLVSISGDSTNVVAGNGVPLAVRVVDPYDNPVPGEQVVFSATLGGGGVAPGAPMSDSVGRVDVTFTTGPVAGENRALGTLNDGIPSGLETAEFVVQTIAGPIAYYEVTRNKATAVAGELVAIDVSAFDANDNLRTQDNTTAIDLSVLGSGSAILQAPTGTLAGGMFPTNVSDTVVGVFSVRVETQSTPSENGTSPSITITPDTAFAVVAVSGDTTGLVVGTDRTLVAEVQDRFGNPKPNATVVFWISSNPGGASMTPVSGITTSNTAGLATITLHTAPVVGDNIVTASILDGTPPNELTTFTVSTLSGGIAYYTVVPDAPNVLAGASLGFTVTAFDGDDNPVDDSTTFVDLSLETGTGAVFAETPVQLVNGSFSTTVSDTLVGPITIRAETQGGGAFGVSSSVTVLPNVPAGSITVASYVPNATITANGISTTVVTTDPIHDQYGNVVAQGSRVQIVPNLGSIDSPDLFPPAPNDQITNASGAVSYQLRSAPTPGTSTIQMTSVAGSATGQATVVFAAPPSIVCNEPPIPGTIVPGGTYAFKVFAQNTSPTAVTLSTGTTFRFNDGVNFFSASLTTPTLLAGLSADTLFFATTLVSSAMTPAPYQPLVQAVGTDAYGSGFSQTCLLPASSLRVSAIQITQIMANPVVSRGATETVSIEITNNSPNEAIIETVNMMFSNGSYNFSSARVPPDTIPAEGIRSIDVDVTIQPFSTLGASTIDAAIAGQVSGAAVSDNSLAPFALPSWTIESAASVVYVAGSLTPSTVSQGQLQALSVQLQNNGQATVTLDPAQTTISFTDGSNTYLATLAGNEAISGGASQTLEFDAVTVAGGFTTASYAVAIHLVGLENGGPFAPPDISTGDVGDQIAVVAPADPQYQAGTLTPTVVSRGATAFFEIDVSNSGAEVELNPDSTRLFFAPGGLYDAALDANLTSTITAAGATLRFQNQLVSNAITAGSYTPTVRLVGTENGLPFSRNLILTNNVQVQDPANLSIVSIVSSQSPITADQAPGFTLTMTVTNSGGSTVSLDSTRVRFIVAGVDRTNRFDIVRPVGFQSNGSSLPGGQTDDLVFNISDNTTNAMIPGNFTIEGDVWVEDQATNKIHIDTNLGGKGSLLVQSRADLVILSMTPTVNPVTVDRAMNFSIEMIVRNSGASEVQVLTNPDSTKPVFSLGTGWIVSGPMFASGNNTLIGGQIDTVRFDVSQVGNTTGPVTIGGEIRGIETNSGRSESDNTSDSGSGTIDVEAQAQLAITSVVPSRSSVTQLSGADWSIVVGLGNTGGSDLLLDLPGSVSVSFQDQTAPSVLQIPATLVGGSAVLPGGATGSLVIGVDSTGAVSSAGTKTITVSLSGQEVTSGFQPISDTDLSAQIAFEGAPSLSYIAQTLDPDTVSTGAVVGFSLDISNVVDAAAVALNPSATRLQFGGYDVGLNPAGNTMVPGDGQPTMLTFNAAAVNESTGSKSVTIDLVGTQNGNSFVTSMNLPAALVVQEAPDLSINAILVSQPTVTRSQDSDWVVTMAVQNNGDAQVDLDLASLTSIGMVSSTAQDVTGQYTIQPPPSLVLAGSTFLDGGATDSLKWTIDVTGTTTGSILINGNVGGIDQNSLLQVTGNTLNGGAGSIIVQAPGIVDIRSLTGPATVTANQAQWTLKMAVQNAGQAAFDVDAVSSSLTFNPAAGWAFTAQTQFLGGGTILTAGQTDTLAFPITATPAGAGPYTIDGFVPAVEINSANPLNDATDVSNRKSILVQAPAALALTVTPSRATVTAGSELNWNVNVAVSNTGGSDVAVDFGSPQTRITFADAIPPGSFKIIRPVAFNEGGNIVPFGQTRNMTFVVDSTSAVATFGSTPIQSKVLYEELNSAHVDSSNVFVGSVIVQQAPQPQYANASLSPSVVSKGASVPFQLNVTNNLGTPSTLHLNAPQTRLRFGGGLFNVQLDPTSVDSIAAGQTATLRFVSAVVNTSIPTGATPVALDVVGTENGNTFTTTINIPANQLTIQTAPDLSIPAILVSQPTVTRLQNIPWTVTVAVQNGGDAYVDIDLTQLTTHINMIAVGLGDATSQYSIQPPPGLVLNGGNRLPGNETDSLKFVVQTTGSTSGPILINGTVGGIDQDSQIVSANTLNGGSGSIVVQEPGVLEIVAITKSQPTVTQNQTQVWTAQMKVRNTGGSAIEVTDDPASTYITFAGSGWQASQGMTALARMGLVAAGPVTLDANDSTTIFFDVTQTGDTTGTIRIDGHVGGVQLNDQTAASDTTDTSGFGSVLVQTPASLSVTQVTTSVPQVTENQTAAWTIAVTVANTGQANAQLGTGPNQTYVAFNTATPPDTVRQPTGQLSVPGGGSTVLTFNVSPTPDFASAGNQAFDIAIGGVELNRNTAVATTSSGSILVQTTADPTYVSSSLAPSAVTRGANVAFQVAIQNQVGSSVLVLNPGTTRFILSDGVTEVRPRLSDISPDSIPGGGQTQLVFDNALISQAFVPGSYPGLLQLRGTENGNPFQRDIATDNVSINLPGQVSIVGIIPSQTRVTTGQTQSWQARMVVQNNGGVPVKINPVGTGLTFQVFGIGDVTSDYPDTTGFVFQGSLTDTLAAAATDTLLFTVNQTGPDAGALAVSGTFAGNAVPTGTDVSDDTFDGGAASMVVEAPPVIDIVSIRPSQSTVTESQGTWTAIMVVRNTGGATVNLNLLSAQLAFNPAPGWVSSLLSTGLEGSGGTLLAPSQPDSLFFQVTSTPSAGPYGIGGLLSGTDVNSGDPVSKNAPGVGSILVQTPAALAIQQIVKSQEPITSGQTTPWTVDVTVANTGQAAATLSLLTSNTFMFFTSTSTTIGPAVGNVALPGDSSRTLRFTVSPTPTFGAGSESFDIQVAGTENNTGNAVSDVTTDAIAVELSPQPLYVVGSVDPQSVARSANVVFQANVQQIAGVSTIALDPNLTRFMFTDGVTSISTRLDGLISDTTINGGETTTLVFENVQIDSAINIGMFPATLQLRGTANGNAYSQDISTTPDEIGVLLPLDVSIQQILVSQPRVTAAQTKTWAARMVVSNTGDSPEQMNSAGTRLTFTVGSDVTGQYTVTPVTVFQISGTNMLGPHSVDTLLFTITRTGTTTGQLRVDGSFDGAAVDDNTFDFGYVVMNVDAPPNLKVTRIRTSQPSVTEGQTAPWQAIVVVENQSPGGAAVDLTFGGSVPRVRAATDPTGYAWTDPTALQGGGIRLSGGKIDSLLFTADTTGTLVGPETLHAFIEGVDVNSDSLHQFDTQAQGSGSGSIDVESRAQLVIESTTISAPQAPSVNTNQTFGVAVRIANQGGADAQSVSYTIATTGGSTPLFPDTMTVPLIAGGTSVTDTFQVLADGVTGPETATVAILNAVDANSQQSTLVNIGPHADDTAAFTKVLPAILSIDAVTPSQAAVTSQQSGWWVDVDISNPGGADLVLTPAVISDLTFFIGPTQQTDYAPVPPGGFVGHTPGDWLVPADSTRTLRYDVTAGAATGSVTIRVSLSATDQSDGSTINDQNTGSVTVVTAAGLFVKSTAVDPATVPNLQGNEGHVNNKQVFRILVEVQNAGGEGVNVYDVGLTNTSASITPETSGVVLIDSGTSEIFAFSVWDSLLVAQNSKTETFTASIDSAVGEISGDPVPPGQPVDNTQVMQIERHANLALSLAITTTSAQDGTVGLGQTFDIQATVANLGFAGVDASGEIALTLPVGYAIDAASPTSSDTTSFTPGTAVLWKIMAPATPAAAQNIVVTMSTTPQQLNVDSLAAVSQASDAVSIETQQLGFESSDLAITLPAGATDAVLSTSQNVTVVASVTPALSTINATATIEFSAGLANVGGPATQNLQTPGGTPQNVPYQLRAPASARVDSFRVVFDGIDNNTSQAVQDSTAWIVVQTVAKADLALGAIISSPPEATGGSVSVGTLFHVQATVQNLGTADIDSTTGALPRVNLNLTGSPYVLDVSSPPATQAFRIGVAVEWIVLAPNAPDVGQLRFQITGAPDDENTDAPAQVSTPLQTIVVNTTESDATVADLSDSLGVGVNVVQRGATDILLLAVEIANPASGADAARIDTIEVALLDQNGAAVVNPAATLSALYATLGGQRVDAQALSQTPMRILVGQTLGGAAVLQPTAKDTLFIGVGVAQSPALTAFAIDIPGGVNGGVVLTSEVSGGRVPVVDKGTSQPGYVLRSQTVTILTNQFAEYAHNYPNPFIPSNGPTKIAYFLESPSSVTVKIFDLAGKLVYEDEVSAGQAGTSPGPQELTWDGKNMQGTSVRNGVYVCRITAGSNSATFKIAVAK